jgi:hypothetical protein
LPHWETKKSDRNKSGSGNVNYLANTSGQCKEKSGIARIIISFVNKKYIKKLLCDCSVCYLDFNDHEFLKRWKYIG